MTAKLASAKLKFGANEAETLGHYSEGNSCRTLYKLGEANQIYCKNIMTTGGEEPLIDLEK